MKIQAVPVLTDNYVWVLEANGSAIVVDPGEAQPVIDYLNGQQLNLTAVLLTHKHADHVGGLPELLAACGPAEVYGPSETATLVSQVVGEGDCFTGLGASFKVIKTAGHTEEHIAYIMGEEALFCGDALFLAGCGRVFTGDYDAQYATLQKIKQLPDHMQVYAAHEYGQTNLRFAQTLPNANEAVEAALDQVNKLRAQGRPSLPSTIAAEKTYNPFLRAENKATFITYRQKRDHF